jgi:methionyl aminopeptidase
MGSTRQIELKSSADLERMRRAGRLAAQVLDAVGRAVAPGVTTKELDRLAEKFIRDAGGVPTFLGYRGYTRRFVRRSTKKWFMAFRIRNGFCAMATLWELTWGRRWTGLWATRPPRFRWAGSAKRLSGFFKRRRNRWTQGIAARGWEPVGRCVGAIQRVAEARAIRWCGILWGMESGGTCTRSPRFRITERQGQGFDLEAGLVIALEPMVNAGTWRVQVLKDGWTVVTEDNRLSAHFEHTVAITDAGCPEILTQLGNR